MKWRVTQLGTASGKPVDEFFEDVNIAKQCETCHYVITDMGKRECKCTKCGTGKIFVVGRDKINDDMSVECQKLKEPLL